MEVGGKIGKKNKEWVQIYYKEICEENWYDEEWSIPWDFGSKLGC